MKPFFLLCCICTLGLQTFSQNKTVCKEYKKIFTTYDFSDPDPIPNATKIYPYFRYDGYAHNSIQKEWKVVELENDFLKVLILPEIGGKIWAAIDKKIDTSFIYYNHTVKFRDVAMRGPWTSGGIEANYGIIGHTPNCATPVDYVITYNPDSSVSCTIGVLDLLSNTQWRMEINLPSDKAFFTTRSYWYNTSGVEQPYYHWMNVGLKVDGNLEYIYPGNKYIGHDGDAHAWPIDESNKKNISFYNNNNFGGYKSYHVYGKLTNYFGAYYHQNNYGMVRYANYDDKAGKKIWIWGLSRQGMIWEKYLTDHDGQYTEVQSGRLFNQNAEKSLYSPFKHLHFTPYGTDDWKEYWYAVANTKGVTTATDFGAFNLIKNKDQLFIYFDPLISMTDSLLIKKNNTVLYEKHFSTKPHQLLVDSFNYSGAINDLVLQVGRNQFSYILDSANNTLSRPVISPKDFDWNNSYGLYIKGQSLMDQKNYKDAELNFVKCLTVDQYFLPSLIKLSQIHIRNFKYNEALLLLKRAISIHTHDPEANYYYGLVNELMNNTVDAIDGYSIASISSDFKSAAYTALARIQLRNSAFSNCIAFAQKAVEANTKNIVAYQLQLVAYRKTGDQQTAFEVISKINAIDKINHFSNHELHLLNAEPKLISDFNNAIQNEMPNETKLQIVASYIEMNLFNEALETLSHCNENAMTNYWSAYISAQLNLPFENYISKAKNQSADFIFPNRGIDFEVLSWVVNKTDDWKASYFLAILLRDRNRVDEAMQLVKQQGWKPNYAPFYAFRAQLYAGSDINEELADFKKAITIDPLQWRYVKQLAEYFLKYKKYSNALSLVEPFYFNNNANYIIGMLYAKALIFNEKYEMADSLLNVLNIIPFEGATQGHELYREVKINLAIKSLQDNKMNEAKKYLTQSKLWPENLGVGKPYDENIDTRLEDWFEYLIEKKLDPKNKNTSTILLNKIIAFTPKVENTVANFYPSNHWITYLAFKALNKDAEGEKWLKNQIGKIANRQISQWLAFKLNSEKDTRFNVSNEIDVNAGLIEKLK